MSAQMSWDPLFQLPHREGLQLPNRGLGFQWPCGGTPYECDSYVFEDTFQCEAGADGYLELSFVKRDRLTSGLLQEELQNGFHALFHHKKSDSEGELFTCR